MTIYEYLKRSFENITAPIRNLYYSLYSMFGLFYTGNPFIEQDKINFTKSLDDFITSRFDVSYNSRGMIWTKKENDLGLVTILDN